MAALTAGSACSYSPFTFSDVSCKSETRISSSRISRKNRSVSPIFSSPSSSFLGQSMASNSFDLRETGFTVNEVSGEKFTIVGQAIEPPAKNVSAAEAAKNAEALGDPGLPLTFDSVKRIPIRPAEWKDDETERRGREIAALGGVTIRRRPPTGPATHFVGPFEFKIENEYNVPRNILEEIVWHKDTEIAKMKESMPLHVLMGALRSVSPSRDFVGALRERVEETGMPALIAEVKKASPSRGVIQPDFDPVRIAKAYEKGGAACLSVLTDSKYFQGSFENLKLIRAAGVQCPLLCKEFIVDAWQIYFGRVKGADAVLLIAAVLPDQDLRYLTKIVRTLGMAAIIEVHSEQEMDRVLGLEGVQIIGINNRNLETFKVDISNTKRLLEGERGEKIRERGILVVGESGLFTPEDIKYVQDAGCGAVLVGESLVKQNDPAAGIAGLFGKDISRVSV